MWHKKCDGFWLLSAKNFPTVYYMNDFAAIIFSRYYTLKHSELSTLLFVLCCFGPMTEQACFLKRRCMPSTVLLHQRISANMCQPNGAYIYGLWAYWSTERLNPTQQSPREHATSDLSNLLLPRSNLLLASPEKVIYWWPLIRVSSLDEKKVTTYYIIGYRCWSQHPVYWVEVPT